MAPWQQRVVDEQVQLRERLDRLSDFLASPTYTALPAADRLLLERQRAAMRTYETILVERINHFR